MTQYEVGRIGVAEVRLRIDADSYSAASGWVTFIRAGEPVFSVPTDRVAYVAAMSDQEKLPFRLVSPRT